MKTWLLLLLLSSAVWAQPRNYVTRAQWGSQPQALGDDLLHTPARITLHHSGVLWKAGDDARKKIKGLQSWGQREKNWPDLPYHFLIDPQGTIFEGRELKYRPESNTDYDLTGVVNLHLWGNFDEQTVTRDQLQATVELLAWLRDQYQLETLQAHCQAAPGQTSCPGKDLMRYLDAGLLRRWVDECRNEEWPGVKELPAPAGKP